MKKVKTAILKTLSYADVFDFPLKKEEIWRWLIKSPKSKVQSPKLESEIQRLIRAGKIQEKDGFYFLKGRKKIAKIRQKREKWSARKLKIAKRVGQFLKLIPLIKMAAVSGALARKNAKKEDDIDLLIVSQKKRLWTTRFLTTVLVEIFAKRRRPGNKKIKNKICLNMFLDENNLGLPVKERDLYSAYEVAQLKPLWDRDETYQKFLAANQWAEKFLPNAMRKIKTQNLKLKVTAKNSKLQDKRVLALSCRFALCASRFALLEKLLKRLQLWYMRKHRTTEIISDTIIRFHPKDARIWVLKEYRKRLRGNLR